MIPQNIKFATTEVVAALRGVTVEAIYQAVDGPSKEGSFTWVFDLSSLPGKRHLRFWKQEIDHPHLVADMTIDKVIESIVPRRDLPGQFCGMRNWEVCDLLRISRRLMLDLRDELEVVKRDRDIYIPRTALEKFLRRRWVFAHVPAQGSRKT